MLSTKLFSFLLDILAPPRPSENVVRHLSPAALYALALPPENYAAGKYVSILPYHHASVAALVWEVKYYANKRAQTLAGALLADMLLSIASEEIGRVLLIPIPIHPERRKERGHNQTELLCKAALASLSGKTSFQYAPDLLLRVRHTPPQQGLPKHRRLKNVRNTMAIQENKNNTILRDRICIVVDDVATTGATFAEARRALRAAGARRIYCVALAGA